MTRITRVEVITNTGRDYVSWEDDNDIVTSIQDEGRTLKVFVNKVKPKTLFDVIQNLGYSIDCSWEIVDAIEEFEKSKEFQPTPQTSEQVEDGLKQAFRESVNQGVVSSVDKPKTLTDILYRWWCDVFTTHSDWDMETSIEDLVDRIELFLPKEQSAAGSQNVYVECSVEGFNDCLNKIKGKLR